MRECRDATFSKMFCGGLGSSGDPGGEIGSYL